MFFTYVDKSAVWDADDDSWWADRIYILCWTSFL